MERSTPAPSQRTRVRRKPERGAYDAELVRAVLSAGLICHVAFVDGSAPVVIPTAYGVLGDEVVVHGNPASRMLGVLRDGGEVCLAVTVVDGLVLARSAFEHSMNYRSVVVFGQARLLDDRDEKLRALRAISEQLLPGRWSEVRPPTEAELRKTHVLALPIGEASVKMRTGPPSPEPDAWDVWTGVLPVAPRWGRPVPDPANATVPLSPSLAGIDRTDR